MALCERVRQWREDSGGGRGKRVPEELWQEAVRVARVVGVYTTAQATRLKYAGLKARVGQTAAPQPNEPRPAALGRRARPRPAAKEAERGRPAERPKSAGPRFVALTVAPPPSALQATIEVVSRGGERMRVEVRGGLDLLGVLQTFWRRAS